MAKTLEDGAVPLFLRAAEFAVHDSRDSVASLLEADRSKAEKPAFPTSLCLLPDEAEDLLDIAIDLDTFSLSENVSNELRLRSKELAEKFDHVRNCSFCQIMVMSMRPPQSRRQEFRKIVEETLRSEESLLVPSESPSDNLPAKRWVITPLTREFICDFLGSSLPVMFLLLFVSGLLITHSNPFWIFSAVATAVVAIGVLSFSLYSTGRFSSTILRHSAGAIAGGVLATTFVGYFGWQNVTSRETLSLKLAQERLNSFVTNSLVSHQTQGKFLDAKEADWRDAGVSAVSEKKSLGMIIYEAEVTGAAAKLVAEMSADKGVLYRIQRGKRTELTKYYLGEVKATKGNDLIFENQSDGVVTAKQGNSPPLPNNAQVAVAIDSERNRVDQIQMVPVRFSSSHVNRVERGPSDGNR